MAAGSILARGGFGPKGRIPAFLQCLCCFSSKVQKLVKPIFMYVGCRFFGNPSEKKSHSDWKFIRFYDFQKKRACFQSPSYSGGGGGTEPQETQKGPNPCIFTLFSSLAQNQKKGLATGSQKAKLQTVWGPRSPQIAWYLHFYIVFPLASSNTCLFT